MQLISKGNIDSDFTECPFKIFVTLKLNWAEEI